MYGSSSIYSRNKPYNHLNTQNYTSGYGNYSSSGIGTQSKLNRHDHLANKGYGYNQKSNYGYGSSAQNNNNNGIGKDYTSTNTGTAHRIRNVSNAMNNIYDPDQQYSSSSSKYKNSQSSIKNSQMTAYQKRLQEEQEEKERQQRLQESKLKQSQSSSKYNQYSQQQQQQQSVEESKYNDYSSSSSNTQSQITQMKQKKRSSVTTRSDRGLVGLNNIGNTCFMNSALQCLFNLPLFNDYFIQGKYKHDIQYKNKGIAEQYAKLVSSIRNSNKGSESTYSLKSSIERVSSQFRGYGQQDAQELLRVVLDGLHEDLNRVQKKPAYRELSADPKKRQLGVIAQDWFNYYKGRDDSIVQDYFCGQYMNKVICQYCGNESLAFDNFLDLSLSFSKGMQVLRQFTLERLFDVFLKEEDLDDTYYCSKCKKHRKSKRQFVFWKMPNILVVHLKRFKFGRSMYGGGHKLNDTVQFPVENLDMSQFCKQSSDPSTKNCVYDLCGIVNHSGSLGGGHYTADCRNPYDYQWYRFNDSYVSPISDINRYESQGSSSPYILFYVKQELLYK